jgi:hypothetical protein
MSIWRAVFGDSWSFKGRFINVRLSRCPLWELDDISPKLELTVVVN